MNDDIEKVQPFDSFSAVYKILAWAGYYKPLNKPTSEFKRVLHQIYRPLALLIVAIYNAQHLIFIAQNRHNTDKMIDSLMFEIPHLNLLTKSVTMYFQTSRIDKLNSFLKDNTTFRASDSDGQSFLLKNKEEMYRLNRLIMTSLTIAILFWPSSHFVRRYNNPEDVVPLYVPFATDTWATFSLSVLFDCGFLLWTGYGHLALDVLISTYYAHAQAQLKIMKQQLEQFVGKEEDRCYLKSYFRYRDLMDENVGKRFVLIVKRYEKLIWYKNEIDAVFNIPLMFQFFSSTVAVCLVVYSMTVIDMSFFQFLFLVAVFFILLAQVFIYCYYGNLLEFESRYINNALYNSDWLSLSPAFRRQMLIAMFRWSQPVQPRVCYIIPLSLTTFLTIVQSSYRMYTVLITAKRNNV